PSYPVPGRGPRQSLPRAGRERLSHHRGHAMTATTFRPRPKRPPRAPCRVRQDRAAQAGLLEDYVRRAARGRGFDLGVSYSEAGSKAKTQTPHWRIVCDGRNLLHWWPSTQRFWCEPSGAKGQIEDVFELIEVVSKLASTVFGQKE